MFKKLRNKFLLLNMIMISVLLICAFSVVFAIIYNNVSSDTYRQLSREAMNMNAKNEHFGGKDDRKFGLESPNILRSGDLTPPNDETASENQPLPPAPNDLFTAKIDTDGSIIEVRSPYEYEQEFYNTVINEALAAIEEESNHSKNQFGVISTSHTTKYDSSYWKYLICRAETNNGGYYLSATNIDTEIGILQKLIITLCGVLLFTLVIVFLICLYFANKSIKPIETAWEKQSQFIADASHELKTPLTTINTNIDVLLAHGESTINSENKWLMYIKDECTRMSKLTNDLLYLARVDHSIENGLVLTDVELSAIVQSTLLTMEAVAYEKKIVMTDEIKDGIRIKGDSSQIKQLIIILLDNAIKYTPEDGTIDVRLTAKDKHAYLSVRNSGGEIPPEDTERIFDRFYRSDKSRSRESGGYGLGLAIAKSIITAHGGTIKLNSRSGYTEFAVKLPAV